MQITYLFQMRDRYCFPPFTSRTSFLGRERVYCILHETSWGGGAHRTSIVAIGQMRRKAGGVLQFASCLNAPSLPARNDRIVTVSNLLFAARGNGDAPEGGKEKKGKRGRRGEKCALGSQGSRLSRAEKRNLKADVSFS